MELDPITPESVRSEIATKINLKDMAWVLENHMKLYSRNRTSGGI